MSEALKLDTSIRRRGLIILLLTILLIVLEIAGILPGITSPIELLELSARDMSFRLRGQRAPAEEIIIVAIDDESLNWVGEQWPWSRDRIAEIVNWLNDAGAAMIALDIFLFDEDPNPESDQALIQALTNAIMSISVNQIYRIGSIITHKPPLPIYQEALDGFGITEIDRDDDAIVRGITSYKTFNTFEGEETYFHWSFEVVRLYKDIAPPEDPTPQGVLFDGNYIPSTKDAYY